MKQSRSFSPSRLWAVVVKEFVQMRRDRMTFGMMIGVPLMQLILFGAICLGAAVWAPWRWDTNPP